MNSPGVLSTKYRSSRKTEKGEKKGEKKITEIIQSNFPDHRPSLA